MSWTFDKIIKGARRLSASDIHLVHGVAPALRITGDIRLLEGEPLEVDDLRSMVDGLLTDKQRRVFEETWQLCFSGHWPGVGRFRASLYYHAGCPELAVRLCE